MDRTDTEAARIGGKKTPKTKQKKKMAKKDRKKFPSVLRMSMGL